MVRRGIVDRDHGAIDHERHVPDASLVFRLGVMYSDNSQTYTIESPLILGDSGGPILHMKAGQALGIVSNINAGFVVPLVRNQGPTVEGMLDGAAARGLTLDLVVA